MSGETGARNEVVPDVAMPSRMNTHRAFNTYVFGRSRKLAPLEKKAAVAETSGPPPSADDGEPPLVEARPASVAVPEELRFHRNAGTWRSS